MKHSLTTATVFLALSTILAPTVSANFSAYNSNDHSSRYLYTLKAGDQIADKFTIVNLDNQPTKINIYGADSTTTLQGDFAVKTLDQTQLNVGAWIKMKNPTLTLQPLEKKEIAFAIEVPEKTPPGTYAGGLAIATSPDTSTSSTQERAGMISVSRVIIKTIINIPGEKIHSFEWSSFSHLDNNNNHSFNLGFKNTGNTSVIADGYVEILGSPDGNPEPSAQQTETQPASSSSKKSDPKTASNILSFNNINLFRSDELEFSTAWAKKPIFGHYTAVAHVTFWEFDVTSGKKINPQSFTKVVEFTIWPWSYIILIILFLIGLAAIITGRSRHYSLLRKNSEIYTVQTNDTLTRLATDNNVNWKKLAKINKIKAPYSLKEGQTILIPLKKK